MQEKIHDGLNSLLAEELGALLAFSLWYGIFDLHNGNVRRDRTCIYIIDGECSFLTDGEQEIESTIDRSCLISSVTIEDSTTNRNGIIAKKFTKTLEYLGKIDHSGFYSEVDSVISRKVLLATKIYSNFLKRRYAFDWDDDETKRKWTELRQLLHPVKQTVLAYEIQSLLNWDVPRFWVTNDRLISGDLMQCLDGHKPLSAALRELHAQLLSSRGIRGAEEALFIKLRNPVPRMAN